MFVKGQFVEDRDRSDGSQKTKSGLINSSSKKIRTPIKTGQEFRGIFFCQAGEGGGNSICVGTKALLKSTFGAPNHKNINMLSQRGACLGCSA